MPSFASRLLKGPEMIADQDYKKKLAEFSQQINPKSAEVLIEHYKKYPVVSGVYSNYDFRLFDDSGVVTKEETFSATSNDEAFRIVMDKALKAWKGQGKINLSIEKQD